jgi:hypothetical protein
MFLLTMQPKETEMPNTNENGNLIQALLEFGVHELNADQAAKLNNLIENNSDATGAVAKDDAPTKRERAERAMDFLRSRAIGESDIDWIRREQFGLEPPTQAQDSALRETKRARDEASFAKHFPDATKIIHSAY